jgi:dTDP-4-dehydrorhamnose 3,5-epimerase
VDIRVGSPSYGQWVGIELSFENGKQLYIPEGFLHGFVTLEPETEIVYKCTDYYSASADGAVRFDDPDLAIDWGIETSEAILSEKDTKAPFLAAFVSPFVFES